MVKRIVRLTIQPDKVEEFKKYFTASHSQIRSFPGCISVSLHHDVNQPEVMITYSKWDSENDLENYRNSELFKTTWQKVKPLFGGAPTAFTMQEDIPDLG